MKDQSKIKDYSIRDIIDFRSILWSGSEDFFYLAQVPVKFEPFFVRPNYYCIGMVTQGVLEIDINNKNYHLQPSLVMIYRPGQVFRVTKITEHTEGVFVLFTKKFLNHLQENIFSVKSYSFLSQGIQTVIELSDDDRNKLLSIFSNIFSLLHQLSKPNWELIARTLTSALIYETDNILHDYIDPDTILSNKEDELYTRFNNLVASDFKISRKLAHYAATLCVTSNYLHVAVKNICGESPMELIQRQVINEAKYLIGYTLLSFSEIADQLNFADPFVFSKYFKKYTGYSPSHYRKHADTIAPAN